MKIKKVSATNTGINITPLVDVVFILLIFFAVSTSFLTYGVLEVNLPKAETAEDTEKKMLRVGITKAGEFFVDGKPVLDGELLERLRREYSTGATLVIEADSDSPHGKAVQVIDSGKLAGFVNFAIAAEAAADGR